MEREVPEGVAAADAMGKLTEPNPATLWRKQVEAQNDKDDDCERTEAPKRSRPGMGC